MFSGCTELKFANVSSLNLHENNEKNKNVFFGVESEPIVWVNEKFINIVIRTQMGPKFKGIPNYGKDGGYIKAIVENFDSFDSSLNLYDDDIDDDFILYINENKVERNKYNNFEYTFLPGKMYYLTFFIKKKKKVFLILCIKSKM